MNCIGNPEVLYCGDGYSNRSFITLQGCTSSHTLSPLTTMYTSCTSATFKRKPGEGVGHDLTNHTSLSSRFIAYSGSIRKEIRPGCRSRPQTMCAGFPSPPRLMDLCLVHRAMVPSLSQAHLYRVPLGRLLTQPTNTRN